MTDDEWQAHVTREAAKEVGKWLEGRGRLNQPIAALTMADLEAMATRAAIFLSRSKAFAEIWSTAETGQPYPSLHFAVSVSY